METKEYFKGIAENVVKRRTKGEYSVEEMRIFEEGKASALRSVLQDLHPENADIWEKIQLFLQGIARFYYIGISGISEKTQKGTPDISSKSENDNGFNTTSNRLKEKL